MRVNRRFLYTGVFLLAVGAVVVAADLGAVGTALLSDALGLWPLAIVAVGLGLLIRHTRIGLAGGLVAALLPGLLVGSAFAVGPRVIADCSARDVPVAVASERGVFDGPATVYVNIGCGSLDVRAAPGRGWQFDAHNSAGRAPRIDASGRSLSIGGDEREGWPFFDHGRDAWELTLPEAAIDDLSLTVNAGDGRADLSGTTIRRLAVTANAADVAIDATGSSVTELSGVVNVGSLSIRLPADGDLGGTLNVNGGRLQVCTPPGLGLRITTTGGFGEQVTVGGLRQAGSEWQSSNYGSATHRADLDLTVNLGSVEIDPIGGCK